MKEPSSGRIFPGHSSLGTPELGRGFCTLLGVDHTSLGCLPWPEGLAIIPSHLLGFLFTAKVTLLEALGGIWEFLFQEEQK